MGATGLDVTGMIDPVSVKEMYFLPSDRPLANASAPRLRFAKPVNLGGPPRRRSCMIRMDGNSIFLISR